jgi:hypothetical protein
LGFSTKTILNKLNDKLVYVPVIFLAFAGIPEPALAGEFTCRSQASCPMAAQRSRHRRRGIYHKTNESIFRIELFFLDFKTV